MLNVNITGNILNVLDPVSRSAVQRIQQTLEAKLEFLASGRPILKFPSSTNAKKALQVINRKNYAFKLSYWKGDS